MRTEVTFSKTEATVDSTDRGEILSPQRRYIVANTSVTLERNLRTTSIDAVLASLSARQRLRYLASHGRTDLFVLGLAFVGGVYMAIAAFSHVFPESFNSLFSTANAAGSQTNEASAFQSSRDSFDWYVGGLMGIALLLSFGMTMFAKDEGKVTFGKDTTKMILGFVVGFLSGGKAR